MDTPGSRHSKRVLPLYGANAATINRHAILTREYGGIVPQTWTMMTFDRVRPRQASDANWA
jgi:hypothetical protein